MELNAEFHGEKNGLQQFQEMGIQNNNQRNGFKYENGGDNSDCYIVDLENFSNGVIDKDHNSHSSTNHANSRITLQRSLSRKVPQRGTERKLSDRDTLAPSSSPRAAQVLSTPEMSTSPLTVSTGSQDHSVNNHQHQHQPQHQITIKTGGLNAMSDGRLGKRSSFKRSSYSWVFDPKRILLFFATLSSMGTMLLIYFTLAMSKANDNEGVLDWQ